MGGKNKSNTTMQKKGGRRGHPSGHIVNLIIPRDASVFVAHLLSALRFTEDSKRIIDLSDGRVSILSCQDRVHSAADHSQHQQIFRCGIAFHMLYRPEPILNAPKTDCRTAKYGELWLTKAAFGDLTHRNSTDYSVGIGLKVPRVLVTKALKQHLPNQPIGNAPLALTSYLTEPASRPQTRHLSSLPFTDQTPHSELVLPAGKKVWV